MDGPDGQMSQLTISRSRQPQRPHMTWNIMDKCLNSAHSAKTIFIFKEKIGYSHENNSIYLFVNLATSFKSLSKIIRKIT